MYILCCFATLQCISCSTNFSSSHYCNNDDRICTKKHEKTHLFTHTQQLKLNTTSTEYHAVCFYSNPGFISCAGHLVFLPSTVLASSDSAVFRLCGQHEMSLVVSPAFGADSLTNFFSHKQVCLVFLIYSKLVCCSLFCIISRACVRTPAHTNTHLQKPSDFMLLFCLFVYYMHKLNFLWLLSTIPYKIIL